MRARHKSSGAKYNSAKSASMKSGTSGLGDIPYNNSGTCEVGKVQGAAKKARLDRRASGGRVNATAEPLAPGSSAHPMSSAAMKCGGMAKKK